jgi:citrate synthase
MNAFWRIPPLAPDEAKLLTLCLAAHAQSVHRENISTQVLKNVAVGSMNYMSAIAAALCSTGGLHAPLIDSWRFLNMKTEDIVLHVEMGGKVPGWGHSFEKDGIDPIWKPTYDQLGVVAEEMQNKIDEVTQELHRHGKEIYANPSALTAAVGIVLGMPPEILGWFFIQGRLSEWSKVFYSTVAATMPQKKEEVEA